MAPPELGGVTAQIMALRELHAARYSAKDVGAALEVVRQMREAEKALHAKSDQVLAAEKKALLAAGPDDDVPRGAGEAMREAAEAHRDKIERLWARLTDAIGERKAGVLRGLLGERFPMMGPGGMMPGQPPMGPMGPGAGPGMRPGGPGAGPGPGPDGPPPGGVFESAFDPGAPEPGGQVGGPPEGMPGGRGRPQPGMGGRQQRFGPGGQGPAGGMMNRGPGMQPPGMGGMMSPPPMMAMGPRLSLADVVELLEQKLAAMRK
jgi:hypothetical protein